MLVIAAILAAGQVSKFDDREPAADYAAKVRIDDVERCLIRSGSAPLVYRQPDRPDDVMLVWSAVSISAGNAVARVDLHKDGVDLTHVRAWAPVKWIEACAPRALATNP